MRRRLNSRAFDPFDEWLESQGLYRKQVARDGSCLFRAVAEQVFMTQTEHIKVRALCLEYMMLHKDDFQPFLEIPLDHHVFKLQDVREWGGHTEIIAMSHLFQVDFLIYQEIGQMPFKATENSYPKTLMLSYTHGNHYDIVYQKDAATIRGFCQSVVYDILYSRVFQLKDVRLAVDTMLHDKEYASLRRDSANSTELKEIGALVEKIMGTNISRDNSQDEADKNTSIDERQSLEEVHPDDVRGLLARGIPPFPYKVAKSLDPDIYRNIEFDAWNTVRREARYGPFDSNGFQAGVKVLIKLELLPNRLEVEKMRKLHMTRQGSSENHDGRNAEERIDVYHGHIQEMSENKGPVDVYVEEIGNRLKVPYESLEKVPPSPPRSPWHASQQHLQTGTGSATTTGVNIPSYKKLTGFYQKAPLPAEPEYSSGRSKKKGGKQMREVLTLVPIPAPLRYCGPSNATGMRGRVASSPTHHGHSPRSRTPQGSYPPPPNYAPKNYSNRGMGRSNNSNYRNAQSPARDGYPLLPVRTVLGDEETHQQMREVTLEALQQVMSAGGQQEVRVIGQQLEVIITEDQRDSQGSSLAEDISQVESSTLAPQKDEKITETLAINREDVSEQSIEVNQNSPPEREKKLQVAPLHPSSSHQTSNGEIEEASIYQHDPSITYISPPTSITTPQVFSPVPATDGSGTPTEFTPPPTSTIPNRVDSWDPNIQGTDSDAMKLNQGMPPFMVYHMPVMYGGYGYGYNQQWAYSYPVMPSPTMDDGKQTPIPGGELYPQMVSVGGWGQGYVGDFVPPQPMPGPPHHNFPPLLREPGPLPYPPLPYQQQQQQDGRDGSRDGSPFLHHHHHRGRGRGPHHYNHHPRGNHHGSHQYSNNYQGNNFQDPLTMGRGGGGQRSLPPRFQRGGGTPPGRGGSRQFQNCGPPHQSSNTPPHLHQRSHQYEGQPLMHMGSRKSSTDSLASQIISGGSVGSGELASPPLVTYLEFDRPHRVMPLPPQDTSPMPPQDHMQMPAPPGYFTAPPGYVVSGPWMWKM
ncbi:OTU domain-containing protein 4 isoform X4 [Cherax quadricarinatus]|uniref:OTU domain-containing protein 4 isoform X4 n=1 Tax=Cherax quadricarinatus TaxID=27406 RepID=UPI00387E94AC